MAPLIEVIEEEEQFRHYSPHDIVSDVLVVTRSPSDVLNAIQLYNKLKSADQRHEIVFLLYRIALYCQNNSTSSISQKPFISRRSRYSSDSKTCTRHSKATYNLSSMEKQVSYSIHRNQIIGLPRISTINLGDTHSSLLPSFLI